MCLAIPSKIISIDDLYATIDVFGARRTVSLMLMPEAPRVGDHVLVHAGFAIQKVENDILSFTNRVFQGTGTNEERDLS